MTKSRSCSPSPPPPYPPYSTRKSLSSMDLMSEPTSKRIARHHVWYAFKKEHSLNQDSGMTFILEFMADTVVQFL